MLAESHPHCGGMGERRSPAAEISHMSWQCRVSGWFSGFVASAAEPGCPTAVRVVDRPSWLLPAVAPGFRPVVRSTAHRVFVGALVGVGYPAGIYSPERELEYYKYA